MPAKKSETDASPTASGIPVYCAHSAIVPISELKPHPANSKKHPKSQIRKLAKIIRRGWRNAIVVSNQSGFIVKGHGRLETAKFLRVEEVPVDHQDYESEEAERADRIADNKISEYGEWDHEKLNAELEQFRENNDFDVELTGMTFEEIDKALDAYAEREEEKEKTNTTEVLEVAVQCDSVDEQQRILAKLSDEGYRVRAAKSKIKDQ